VYVVEVMPRSKGRLPDFLVIGAMKAGTTSLYHYLAPHPEIFMASVKELDFFVESANWRRGLDWYARQFDDAGDAAVAGEASTAYSKHPVVPGVPERISTVLPDAKIVYVLRDPIDRIRSHYQHRVAIGSERAPFAEAVLRDPIYVVCSSYGMQIERYLDRFPRERLLLLTAERLRTDREATVRRVYGFLGVDEDVVPATLGTEYYRSDGRARYPPIVARLRHALKARVPAAKRAKELVDSTLPHVLRGGRHPEPAAPRSSGATVSDETRATLLARLQDDLDRLAAYAPGALEDWSLDRRDRAR
jgi:sulfotransferase family protein